MEAVVKIRSYKSNVLTRKKPEMMARDALLPNLFTGEIRLELAENLLEKEP